MIKNRTNCPNCGAGLKWGQPHCEYCGTRIVDLTMIDFDTDKPTAFMFKLPHDQFLPKEYDNKDIYVSMMAKPELGLVSMTANCTEIRGGWGNPKLAVLDTGRQFEMEVKLHSYQPAGKKDMLTVWKEDRKC